jgi:hypothetical protein
MMISIDIGVRNLGWCVVDTSDGYGACRVKRIGVSDIIGQRTIPNSHECARLIVQWMDAMIRDELGITDPSSQLEIVCEAQVQRAFRNLVMAWALFGYAHALVIPFKFMSSMSKFQIISKHAAGRTLPYDIRTSRRWCYRARKQNSVLLAKYISEDEDWFYFLQGVRLDIAAKKNDDHCDATCQAFASVLERRVARRKTTATRRKTTATRRRRSLDIECPSPTPPGQ